MAAPFGFSVGDFISAIQLVSDVVQALKDSAGSSSHFVELIRELYSLERALLEVKNLSVSSIQEPELAAIKQAGAQCLGTIEEFLKKNLKFFRTLREGGSSSKLRDALHKVEWQLFRKEDVQSFRIMIRGHTSAITMLLLTFQL
jgi:hypothetical protein